MYFNRFRIEKLDGMSVMYFGLVIPSTGLADYYCCAMSDAGLKGQCEILLAYLERIGRPKQGATAWQGTIPSQHKIDVADMINMANHSGTSEIVFAVYSLWAATTAARTSATEHQQLDGQPLALLRCETELQQQFIEALYA